MISPTWTTMSTKGVPLLPVLALLIGTASADDVAPLVAMFAQQDPALRPELVALSLDAHHCANQRGEIWTERAGRLITVIDYELPSSAPRLWVLDIPTGQILFRELVSHGENTGDIFSWHFSNDPESHQSSLGLYRTGEIYQGTRGLSLRLDGLESGVNDQARERLIVIHGAHYNSPSWLRRGQLGRSWGCPALDLAVSGDLITTIAGGSLVFAYGADPDWLTGSVYLDCPG
jgi:hypothetical protein